MVYSMAFSNFHIHTMHRPGVSIVIPITVAKNGEGPTILFTGANHGDEYEGPVALFDLANKIKAEDLSGRVNYCSGNELSSFPVWQENITD